MSRLVQPLLLFFFFASDRRRSTFPSLPSPQPSPPLSLKKKKKISPSYVQQLQKSAQTGPKAGPTAEELRKQKKKLEEEQARELASLFACVAIKQPKLQPGVDPKSVVCEFFRAGQCAKGFKCKYSHDLAVERKTRKIDLFSDMRGGADGEEEEGMEDWDQGETREFSPPLLFSFCLFYLSASRLLSGRPPPSLLPLSSLTRCFLSPRNLSHTHARTPKNTRNSGLEKKNENENEKNREARVRRQAEARRRRGKLLDRPGQQPHQHHLQALPGGGREEAVRLVLAVPQREQGVQIQASCF